MTRPESRPTLLIAHGAWHQPSSWAATCDALAELGYRTRVPALPSAGRNPAPTGSMYDDAEVIRRELSGVDGPVVVLAHSYGGIPVTEGVAGATSVSHLIYLAAYMLDAGESMYSFHGMETPSDTSGTFPLMENPREALYHDVADELADKALGQLVDQSLRSFADKVSTAAWQDISSTYVVCGDDRAVPPALQETMAARATASRTLATGHSPYLAAPHRFAALVDEIIRSAPAAR
ncbi:pimeloyl-ACP methyl ester carboxylesterase [Micromonospora pisi]|uniref:Pimeloyl-ACP methyl ester carboxylesterase n=1 Tax=Micromonospora pisi TaxID=589240 RepID=A0A495JBP4_9ACTN|nr:alpha/beta hydrolase [Micromonospora pisi]RKR86430.1 pimeloyl-ACP methyl ester carboxylesterase [Micromonospora pisi]